MTAFLENQLDYVFFFYGLAFILLAVIAWVLKRRSLLSFPWGWLALFGLAHGAHEWLMLVERGAGGMAFVWVRFFCLLISFACLLEFARAGTEALYGKGLGRWIFFPLLALVCAGGMAGIAGLNVATRYALGLTGGLWSAWALFQFSRLNQSRSLAAAAWGMACYALATGVIVPSASFFPASVFNQDAFLRLTGLPVELLCGALALFIAGMMGRYDLSQATRFCRSEQADLEIRCHRQIVWSIIVFLLLGWVFAETMGYRKQTRMEQDLLGRAQLAAGSLDLEKVRRLTATPADEATADYQQLREQLTTLVHANGDIRYILLCGMREGKEFNYVCSRAKRPQNDVGPGFVYHTKLDENAARFFEKGKEFVRSAYKDDQGEWVSALIPVLREDGSSRLLVALSMDVAAKNWLQGIAFRRLLCMGLTLTGILFVVVFFGVRHREKIISLEVVESLAWKHAIFENSSAGVVVVNEERIIIEANARLGEMFGYQHQEIIGQSLALLHISQEAFQQFGIHAYEAVERDEIIHIEQEMAHKDGTHFWCELSGKAIDAARLNKGVIWTLFDITERKRSEEKLRESLTAKSLLQEIINRSPVAVFVWEAKENWPVEYVSGKTEEIFGYTPDDFLQGKISYASVIHPEDLYRVAVEVANYDKQGAEEFSQEYRIITRQGESKWIDDRTYVWRDEKGMATRHQGIIVDITERKRTEEERVKISKLQSIELLAAGVAHDLNNILTSLSANVQLAIFEHEMGKNVTERLQSADDACERAAALASQLLSFSKPNAPIVKTVNIGEFVKAIVRFSLHGSKCVADISVPEGKWLSNVDENQIGQVVNNIVINAIQAMPHGGRVTVRVGEYQWNEEDKLHMPSGAYIKITIADEGVGMTPECQNRIFDPYFTTKQAGSGLGLTTSYSIIKRHGGAITVDSEAGRGSCFSIYLPALSPDTPLASGALQVKTEPKLRGGLRILFMDDDPHVRASVRNLFTLMGYQVNVAAHGAEALEMFKQAREEGIPYHFIMLDLTIPGGMGGKATIECLKEIDPQVIAIVVSGYTDDPIMLNYQEHGFRAALSKPLRIQAVKEVLMQIEAEVGAGQGEGKKG